MVACRHACVREIPVAKMKAEMLALAALCCALTAAGTAQASAAPACVELALTGGAKARIEPGGGDDTLRIRILPPGHVLAGVAFRDDLPSAMLPPAAAAPTACATVQAGTFFASGSIKGTVQADGSLDVQRAGGSELIKSGPVVWSSTAIAGLQLSAASLELQTPPDPVYGLGQHHDPTQRDYQLAPDNGETTVPLMHWPRAGASLLINVPSSGKLTTKPGGVSWQADACLQLDMWVGATPAAVSSTQRWPQLLSKYIRATGQPAALPAWATGFIQSKDRYASQGAIQNVSAGFAQRHTPLSMIVIDWQSWSPGPRGDEDFGAASWPDPRGMNAAASMGGVELMVSPYHNMVDCTDGAGPNGYHCARVLGRCGQYINNISCGQPSQCPPGTWDQVIPCIQAEFKGAFALGASDHLPAPASYGGGFLYDLWSEAGTRMMMDNLARHYSEQYNMSAFWLDCDEPCGGSSWTNETTRSLLYRNGSWPAQLVGAAYPSQLSRVTVDGLRARGVVAPVVLARSSWAGGHTSAAMVWNGDRASSFQEMQKCFRSGLHAGVSGLFYWTTDIGGYAGHPNDPTGNPSDPTCCTGVKPGAPAVQLEQCCDNNVTTPLFRELIVRWYQMGAFHPIFRSHGHRQSGPGAFADGNGASSTNEYYNFGAEAAGAIRRVMMIRESLRPYIAAQFKLIESSGIPIARPLGWDFPEDGTAWATTSCGMETDCPAETQQMFGPDLMIAPQLHLGATSRQVYLPKLPAGEVWQNWFTNTSLGSGGNTIEEQTPLYSGTFPLYRRVAGPPGPPPPPPPPPPPAGGGYDQIGNGFCVSQAKARVQNWLCDDTGLHPDTCPKTEAACAALCTKDTDCTGFMMQDMSMYQAPTTCALVTPTKPRVAGNWQMQDQGNGFLIAAHDGETRDTCYKKKNAGPPPTPPPAGSYDQIGNGFCVSQAKARVQNWLCDDTGLHPDTCPKTEAACAALCTKDTDCTGFMMQDMSMYQAPTTCALVTPTKPGAAGKWQMQDQGNGFLIAAHDGETRDTCYKKKKSSDMSHQRLS